MGKRIGFSFWGTLMNFRSHRFNMLDTPDGHRYGRPLFVKELLRRNNAVITLQQRRDNFDYACEYGHVINEPELFPDLDVLFLEWRWKTWKNDGSMLTNNSSKHEPDYDRQLRLIEYYKDRCPIIVWDTDLKVTQDDEERWPWLIMTDPSFKTNRLTRDRVSIPFWTDFKELLPVTEPYPIYGYIGNNYERPEEFKKYYYNVATVLRSYGIQTSMHGNWLQRSPERESPEQLILRYSDVAFNHRMSFFDSMSLMNRFICTTHVSKPRYYEVGFLSPRYFEAATVGCPALVPKDFRVPNILGDAWVVTSTSDVIEKVNKIKGMSLEQRKDIISLQISCLKKAGNFDVSNVVDFIESRC